MHGRIFLEIPLCRPTFVATRYASASLTDKP
jgi:hypothetical protein